MSALFTEEARCVGRPQRYSHEREQWTDETMRGDACSSDEILGPDGTRFFRVTLQTGLA